MGQYGDESEFLHINIAWFAQQPILVTRKETIATILASTIHCVSTQPPAKAVSHAVVLV